MLKEPNVFKILKLIICKLIVKPVREFDAFVIIRSVFHYFKAYESLMIIDNTTKLYCT